MKRTLAYIAAAIILGFVVARLPIVMHTGRPEYMSPLSLPDTQSMNAPAEQYAREDKIGEVLRLYGYGPGQPSSLLSSSLIFLSGLIAALTVYVILKKRML